MGYNLNNDIKYEQVKQLFDYNSSGYLIRKITTSSRAIKNNIVGTKNHYGYLQVSIKNKQYKVHRLIWLWHYGYMSENSIDHINGDKLDNRIENLREINHQCNIINTGNHKNNTSGIKGVKLNKKTNKWQANIIMDGKEIYLGLYKNIYNAVLARLTAEICFNWTNCNNLTPAYEYAIKHKLINKKGIL